MGCGGSKVLPRCKSDANLSEKRSMLLKRAAEYRKREGEGEDMSALKNLLTQHNLPWHQEYNDLHGAAWRTIPTEQTATIEHTELRAITMPQLRFLRSLIRWATEACEIVDCSPYSAIKGQRVRLDE